MSCFLKVGWTKVVFYTNGLEFSFETAQLKEKSANVPAFRLTHKDGKATLKAGDIEQII